MTSKTNITAQLQHLYTLEQSIAALSEERDQIKDNIKARLDWTPGRRLGPVYDDCGGTHYLLMTERVDKVFSPRALYSRLGLLSLRYMKVCNTLLKTKQPAAYADMDKTTRRKQTVRILRWG